MDVAPNGAAVTISSTVSNAVRYEWYFKNDGMFNYRLLNETQTSEWNIIAGPGSYGWYRMVAYDAQGNQLAAEPVLVRSPRVYVSTTGSDENDGSSWATAVASVQHAIENCFGNEVWVASGTYVPMGRPNGGSETDNRQRHFSLRNNVSVYGGFAGTETALGERDLLANETILSGDFNGNDVYDPVSGALKSGSSENAYYVFYHPQPMGVQLNNTAVLGNVTIRGGSPSSSLSSGGGMRNLNRASPRLVNCVFTGNLHAGLYNGSWSSPEVIGCAFNGNAGAAGVYDKDDASPVLDGCTFYRNSGNGLQHGYSGTATVVNSTFYRNGGHGVYVHWNTNAVVINCTSTENEGGGIVLDTTSGPMKVINSIVWGNKGSQLQNITDAVHCIVQGGASGTNNIDADPLLREFENYGGVVSIIPVAFGSCAVEAGINQAELGDSVVLPTVDARGVDRTAFSRPTIGAYEPQAIIPSGQPLIMPILGTGAYTIGSDYTLNVVWSETRAEMGFVFKWYKDGLLVPIETSSRLSEQAFRLGTSDYRVEITLDDKSWSAEYTVTIYPSVIYVSGTGDDANDGTSPVTAKRSLDKILANLPYGGNFTINVLGDSSVYAVNDLYTLTSGVTLNIEDGAIIKFADGAGLNVEGGATLNIGKAVLTHLADDTIGGDTNEDGNRSVPSHNQYTITGSGQISISADCDFRFKTFEYGGTLSVDQIWIGNRVYRITSDVVVPNGVSLTILEGAILKFDQSKRITVQAGGSLYVAGARNNNVIFTSIKDDVHGGDTNGDGISTIPSMGDWRSLLISGHADFRHCKLLFGGNTNSGGWSGAEGGVITYLNGSTGVVDSCLISDGKFDGVSSYSPSLLVENTTVFYCDRAIQVLGGQADLVNCVFYGMTGNHGVLAHGGIVRMYNSVLSKVSSSFIYAGSSITIKNCLFWNPAGYGPQSYSAVGSNGNLWSDPLFHAAENGDFTLKIGSPCIDAGDGSVAPERDFFGQERVDDMYVENTGTPASNGACPDIGIHEMSANAVSDVDLAVSKVVIPASANVGDTIQIRYTVTNVGSLPARGTCRNEITFVGNSTMPNRSANAISSTLSLEPNESVELTASVTVPSLAEGDWHLQILLNPDRAIFEGRNTDNNLYTTSDVIRISMAALGGTTTAVINGNSSQTFRVEASASEAGTILIYAPEGLNIYGAFGYVPGVGQSDIKAVYCGDGVYAITVPQGEGSMYLTVENPTIADKTIQIEKPTAALSILGVSTNTLPNTGQVTLSLYGTGFTASSLVEFRSNGQTILPNRITCISPVELSVTFALDNATAGDYDIIVSNGFSQVTFDRPIQVLQTSVGPKLTVTLEVPSGIRPERWSMLVVNYTNEGDADAHAPIITLFGETEVFLSPDNGVEEFEHSIRLFGLAQDGNPLVIAPGKSYSMLVQFKTASTGSAVVISNLVYNHGKDIIAWSGLFNLASSEPEKLQRLYDAYGAENTTGYYDAIFADVQKCADIGIRPICAEHFFRIKSLCLPESEYAIVKGTLLHRDTGAPVPDVVIHACTAEQSSSVAVSKTDANGRFFFYGIGKGTLVCASNTLDVEAIIPINDNITEHVEVDRALLFCQKEEIEEAETRQDLSSLHLVGIGGMQLCVGLNNGLLFAADMSKLAQYTYYKSEKTYSSVVVPDSQDNPNEIVVFLLDGGGKKISKATLQITAHGDFQWVDYKEHIENFDYDKIVLISDEIGNYTGVALDLEAGSGSSLRYYKLNKNEFIDIPIILMDSTFASTFSMPPIKTNFTIPFAVGDIKVSIEITGDQETEEKCCDWLQSSGFKGTGALQMKSWTKIVTGAAISTGVDISGKWDRKYTCQLNAQANKCNHAPIRLLSEERALGGFVWVDLTRSVPLPLNLGKLSGKIRAKIGYNNKLLTINGSETTKHEASMEFSLVGQVAAQAALTNALKDALEPEDAAYIKEFTIGITAASARADVGVYYDSTKGIRGIREELSYKVEVTKVFKWEGMLTEDSSTLLKPKFTWDPDIQKYFDSKSNKSSMSMSKAVNYLLPETTLLSAMSPLDDISVDLSHNTVFAPGQLQDGYPLNNEFPCLIGTQDGNTLAWIRQVVSDGLSMGKLLVGDIRNDQIEGLRELSQGDVNVTGLSMLAINDSDLLVVWAQAEPLRDSENAFRRSISRFDTRLYYAVRSSGAWSSPRRVTNADVVETRPKLGFDSLKNVPVVVWMGMNDSGEHTIMSASYNADIWQPPNAVLSTINNIEAIEISSWRKNDTPAQLLVSLWQGSDNQVVRSGVLGASGWAMDTFTIPVMPVTASSETEQATITSYASLAMSQNPIFSMASAPSDGCKEDCRCGCGLVYFCGCPVATCPCKGECKGDGISCCDCVDKNGIPIHRSNDPNEMTGPAGAGEQRYVIPGEWLDFKVYFENMATATAAAQEVHVNNALSQYLDWSSFEFAEVSFANQIEMGLRGLKSGQIEVAQKGTSTKVRVEASYNESTGKVYWYMRSVDPSTVDKWPLDPYAGFLLPNDETGRGEGYVAYRAKVKADAPHNARIDSSADIIFDYNEVIVTDPAWFNTVYAEGLTAPEITTPPSDATKALGASASFTVAATGYEPMSYQWFKDGVALEGQTSATLTLSSVLADDAGLYTVAVTNIFKSVTSEPASLTVLTPPEIAWAPNAGSQTVQDGATATFVVEVTAGSAPFTYAWFKDNVLIASATAASYTTPAALLSDNGAVYKVEVSNAADTASLNATLTVVASPKTIADQYKSQIEDPGTATVTISGTVDFSLVGGITIPSGKTIEGADASSTIIGGVTIPAGASGNVIIGINFTEGTLTINGASDVEVTHCTFTDTPVTITDGADNISFSWNEFTATGGGSGSAMTISNAGAGTGILLHNNLWGDGLKSDMPGVTNARVYMYNNYFTATGNTTATVAGAGAQILSVNNIYEGTHNPLTTQSTGLLHASGNSMISTTGTTEPGNDEVFVPSYSHIINPADTVTKASIAANAGNTAGKNSSTPAQMSGTAGISATVTGSGASKTNVSAHVPAMGGFTLASTATGFAPAARQWYLDNFAIAGATSGSYAVINANAAAHAGTYAVALTAGTGEIVTSGAFTVTVGALAPPVITSNPVSKTINVGGSATFTVVATGESLSYQWRKGGSSIAGATGASHAITNAQQSHAGNYSVLVMNPSGTVTSSAATLTVTTTSGTGGNNGGNNNSGGGGGGGAVSLWWLAALAALAVGRLIGRRTP
ncbi:hypothetical protein M2447_002581 [Ereboglobus sp. PH5-10]|nr:hypothetical protein [Ereboglobus sp. PH5-10]